jgi:hypothetical protein
MGTTIANQTPSYKVSMTLLSAWGAFHPAFGTRWAIRDRGQFDMRMGYITNLFFIGGVNDAFNFRSI